VPPVEEEMPGRARSVAGLMRQSGFIRLD